jgi:hypothetical protein
MDHDFPSGLQDAAESQSAGNLVTCAFGVSTEDFGSPIISQKMDGKVHFPRKGSHVSSSLLKPTLSTELAPCKSLFLHRQEVMVPEIKRHG